MTKHLFFIMQFAFTTTAFAQNNLPDSTGYEAMSGHINEVVVTGTMTARTLKNTPVLTKVISGDDIRQSGG
jgi:hypothetical protein